MIKFIVNMVSTCNYLSLEKQFLTKFFSSICSPVPTYSWKIIDSEGNEKPIVDGENNIVFADGDSRILQIKSTKKSHAGKYICTATIGENSDSVEGELTYQGTDNVDLYRFHLYRSSSQGLKFLVAIAVVLLAKLIKL